MEISIEKWQNIQDCDGLYQISTFGNVRSFVKNKQIPVMLKQEKIRNGYLRVCIIKNGKYKHVMVHRLVADAFIPNPLNLPFVNHKDENKLNNFVENLEWCTSQYNTNYGTRNLRTAMSRRKPILVIDKQSGKVYTEHSSMVDAALYWGVSVDQIIYYCRTKRKPRCELLKRYNFVIKHEKDVCSRSRKQRKRY